MEAGKEKKKEFSLDKMHERINKDIEIINDRSGYGNIQIDIYDKKIVKIKLHSSLDAITL